MRSFLVGCTRLVLSLSTAGCSTATTMSIPRVQLAMSHGSPSPCRVAGSTKVLTQGGLDAIFERESTETTSEDRPYRSPLGGPHDDLSNVVPMGGGRLLLLSTENGTNGSELRAQVIASWGEPVGASLQVSSPEVNVIRPAGAVLESTGRGVVIYFASRSETVDMLGTPISCAL